MTTWIELAGWTLLHFLWQGGVIWGVASAALRVTRAPQTRHAVACCGLAAMLAAPIVTAWTLSDDGRGTVVDTGRTAQGAEAIAAGAVNAATAVPLTSSSNPRGTAADAFRAAVDAESIMPFVVIVWLSGVAVLLARLAGGCWRLRRLRNAAYDDAPSSWQAICDAIARRLRLSRPVFVVDSDWVDTPTVIGWLNPVIVLPLAAMASLAPAQVEAILAHELAHIRRHDFLVNVLQTVAETLLFYHPAVWSMSNRIRAEREHCCDDIAVEVCGDPVAYAAALTELAAWSVARPPLVLAATSGSLIVRIRRLLHRSPDDAPRTSSRLLAGALALALVMVIGSVRAISVTPVSAQDGSPVNDGRFGPPDVNDALGFELFPGPKRWPADDPRSSRAWGVTIRHASGEMPLMGFSARSLIRHAYGAHGIPIVGVPQWLDEESFDLRIDSETPVTPGIADPDGLNTALRQLLEERLGLAVHREQREFPVYALVMADPRRGLGPAMAVATSDCWKLPGRPRTPTQRVCGIEDSLTGLRAQRMTMAEFASEIRATSPLAPGRPVVDRTGLSGEYDFRIRFGFLPVAAIASGHPAFAAVVAPLGFRTIHTALPEQLGLELEESTAPFEVLVIDHIQRPPQ
jgi:uncharacterized protein (TIGR03435 family)